MTLVLGPTKTAAVTPNLASKLIEEGFGFIDQEGESDDVILWDDSEDECFEWLNKQVENAQEYD